MQSKVGIMTNKKTLTTVSIMAFAIFGVAASMAFTQFSEAERASNVQDSLIEAIPGEHEVVISGFPQGDLATARGVNTMATTDGGAESQGWTDETYKVTVDDPTIIDVEIVDCCLFGDYYELWISQDQTEWTKVGETPVVEYNPGPDYSATCGAQFTGAGATNSQADIAVALESGMNFIKVRNAFFDDLDQCEIDLGFGEPAFDIYDPAGLTVTFLDQKVSFTKEHTHTNVDFDLVCDGFVNPQDGMCYEEETYETPMALRYPTIGEASFGDTLEDSLLEAVVKKNGKVSSYNPGQWYSVVTIDVLTDLDELHISDYYEDCLDIGKVNPDKVPGGALVVVIDDQDNVMDISDVAAENGDLMLNRDGSDNAIETVAWLEDIPADYQVKLYTKFSPAQKGEDFAAGTCDDIGSFEGTTAGQVEFSSSITEELTLVEKINE